METPLVAPCVCLLTVPLLGQATSAIRSPSTKWEETWLPLRAYQ